MPQLPLATSSISPSLMLKRYWISMSHLRLALIWRLISWLVISMLAYFKIQCNHISWEMPLLIYKRPHAYYASTAGFIWSVRYIKAFPQMHILRNSRVKPHVRLANPMPHTHTKCYSDQLPLNLKTSKKTCNANFKLKLDNNASIEMRCGLMYDD
jgi:hypothetical protein